MSKMKKKFMALLIVFTNIISFLPVGFSGQTVKADTVDPSAISVGIGGQLLTPRTDTSTKEPETIYTTQAVTEAFEVTVNDVRKTLSEISAEALSTGQTATEVTDQKVEIISINGISCLSDEGKDILSKMGVTYSTDYANSSATAQKRIGKIITGLPYGVNKIKYKVTVTTDSYDYVSAIKSADGTQVITQATTKRGQQTVTPYAEQYITIEHATSFAINKVQKMIFNSFVGASSVINPDTGEVSDTDLAQNNTVPFLYSTTADPDKNMALRYTFDVPDSTTTLSYNMFFGAELDLSNAKIFKNGKKDDNVNYNSSTHRLHGNLERAGTSDLILVQLDSSSGKDKSIQKTYAIEIRYNYLYADYDYSIKKGAGITKLDYNDDNNVKAYIGKKFDVTTEAGGYKKFTGNIYIDPKARMVNIDPILVRDRDTVTYVLYNKYLDSTGSSQTKPSELINGKQYIDFKASTTSNQLQLYVYNKDKSKLLALYALNVLPPSGSTGASFDMQLKFSDGTRLTQPGVSDNTIEKFTTSRRTYDLYQGANPLMIALAATSRTDNNEYIRVWLGTDVNGNNLQEAQESVNNTPNANNVRALGLNVNIAKTIKKIVVQAYYDQAQSNADGTPKMVDGKQVYVSCPIGDKYVFYLPANYDGTDITTPSENSTDANLSSIKIQGCTLTDSDGNTGFSKDKTDYTTTVIKTDTSEKMTVVAEDSNAKSIVATINGSDQTYDLFSGEENEIPLDSSGKTTIKIVVTAQDGVTKKTYTVTIKNNTKSNNINLKNVILNVGDYTFDPKVTITKVRVDQNVTSIQVTPIPEEPKSKTSVNGEQYSGTPITVSIKGNQKTTINIEVASEDGSMSKTYTLEIYRVDVADWNDNNSNNDTDTDDQFYDEYNDCWVDLSKYDEWGTVNGKPAYFDKKSRQVKSAWITTGGKNYYLDNLGFRASGWKIDGPTGKTYYLDPTTGEMRTGWINLNNVWYYLGLNGVMHKGWLYLNGKWYYFTPNGQMVINQTMYVDDKLCVFGQDGALIY